MTAPRARPDCPHITVTTPDGQSVTLGLLVLAPVTEDQLAAYLRRVGADLARNMAALAFPC